MSISFVVCTDLLTSTRRCLWYDDRLKWQGALWKKQVFYCGHIFDVGYFFFDFWDFFFSSSSRINCLNTCVISIYLPSLRGLLVASFSPLPTFGSLSRFSHRPSSFPDVTTEKSEKGVGKRNKCWAYISCSALLF